MILWYNNIMQSIFILMMTFNIILEISHHCSLIPADGNILKIEIVRQFSRVMGKNSTTSCNTIFRLLLVTLHILDNKLIYFRAKKPKCLLNIDPSLCTGVYTKCSQDSDLFSLGRIYHSMYCRTEGDGKTWIEFSKVFSNKETTAQVSCFFF